ncbi:MAG TPA: hypothetical protein PLO51_00460 [Candidatus Micrarchaeota archaeon]|nr:hypothetical protein [Candidatus Micrarchaeota archaeon]
MRHREEINIKIAELERSNKKRLKPSEQRLDIIEGLKFVAEKGKYSTLHDWEEKKSELAKMENVMEFGYYKYCRRGMWGEVWPGDKMDSIAWRIASYQWALKIESVDDMKIKMSMHPRLAVQKKKIKEE